MLYFFFFKQKTAYEMRISDWSSDVCSSDLGDRRGPGRRHHPHHQIGRRRPRLREPRRGAAGTAPLRRLPAGLQPPGAALAADRRPRPPREALTQHPGPARTHHTPRPERDETTESTTSPLPRFDAPPHRTTP